MMVMATAMATVAATGMGKGMETATAKVAAMGMGTGTEMGTATATATATGMETEMGTGAKTRVTTRVTATSMMVIIATAVAEMTANGNEDSARVHNNQLRQRRRQGL